MMTLVRTLVAIFAGLLVLFLLLIGVELFSNVVHPFPADFGGTTEEICRHVERYPAWVLAVCVPAWGFAALAGVWTARRTGNLFAAAIVGLLLVVALVCNVSMLPYPIWFKIASLIVIPAAALVGTRPWKSRQVTAAADGR